jgi:hypothetical protein
MDMSMVVSGGGAQRRFMHLVEPQLASNCINDGGNSGGASTISL